GEGRAGAEGGRSARAPERADPAADPRWRAAPDVVRRRAGDGNGVQLAGNGPVFRGLTRLSRLSGADGDTHLHGRPGDPGESPGGSPVRGRGPADPVRIGPGTTADADERAGRRRRSG